MKKATSRIIHFINLETRGMKKLHEGLQKGGVKPATTQKKPSIPPMPTAPKKP